MRSILKALGGIETEIDDYNNCAALHYTNLFETSLYVILDRLKKESEVTNVGANNDFHIFVSYSSQDRKWVGKLVGQLESHGYLVSWDRKIQAGDDFSNRISAAIESTPCVLVVWSKASISSNWVRDEATVARDSGKLVPVSIEGTTPPLGFRQIHTIDMSAWSGLSHAAPFDEIIVAINKIVEPKLKRAKGIKSDVEVANNGWFSSLFKRHR